MTKATPKKTRTTWIWTGAAIAVLLVFYFVHQATRTTLPIRAAVAERSGLQSKISSNGKVEPQNNFEAHAPFPGLIKKLYVQEGDKIPAGKLLLTMDDADARSRLATAEAALKGAQANYAGVLKGGTQEERLSLDGQITKAQMDRNQAQRDLASLEKLQQRGAAAPSEVAAAKDRLAAANSGLQVLQARKTSRYDSGDIAHAKASLDDAQAGYAAAEEALNQANVRAPLAGTVYSLPVAQTEFVQQGSTLLQIADLTKMQVRGYFDEPDIGKLKEGLLITLTSDTKPNRVWHGHIARLPSTIISYGTRSVGVALIAIDDADGTLIPNTSVTVAVTTADIPDALTVPRDALHTEQGKSYVYKVINGTLRRTPVVPGSLNLTQVQIVSGLNEGDTVTLGTTNGLPVSEGVAVRIVR